MEPHTALVDQLREQQREQHLTDEQMATLLGISRQAWQLYRTAPEKLPCPPVFSGILRTYPALTGDVLAYLKDGNKETA